MDSVNEYKPSADSARLAMKAGRLALEAVEAGVSEEKVYDVLRSLALLPEIAHQDPDLMCDNKECEECYG